MLHCSKPINGKSIELFDRRQLTTLKRLMMFSNPWAAYRSSSRHSLGANYVAHSAKTIGCATD
jgi:hypothetical protein